ncbi:neurotransmitter:Na+ symporter, NSS family [Gracilibacillus ureilyticus]|uniref:Transporter n=1 Tax=Gracilibacillus ureilyticus TaxID=531814 RepID=A0A1H9V296_9BACI|nr:sodium-dependent transporter [Gracilibacillus ureilyticus]SES15825.1 neurotransmitter:Na+ symporter, NSS family [Gracilibacillus ureilyticus]
MREQWSSRIGFIMASAGAAIGLGAIWKFPYVAGMNGGAAFFLIFIIFTLVIGLAMLISEFIIGRGAKKEAITAYRTLAPNSQWKLIGQLGVLGCFLLLSFYSVVGGWVFIYSMMSVTGQVIKEGADYPALFGSVTSSPLITLIGLAVFLLINVLVISLGIKNGIEKANKYMMPLLFIFFLILVVRSITLDGAMTGISFFLNPDFSKITGEGVLYALGQSFFALAVGFSCMVTYSSYLGKKVSIPASASSVVMMNIFVSLLAGLAIFPAVFAFGMEPTEGPGLLFIILPTVFAQIPLGEVFFSLFLLLFLFATLTSSFSLLEIIVSAFTESGKRSRRKVTWISGFVMFIAGIPAALSMSTLSEFKIYGRTVFDATDYLVSNMLLPLGSFLIAIFIMHRMDKALVAEQFHLSNNISQFWYKSWRFVMTWIVPVTIIVVYVNLLGIFGN